MMAPYAKAGGGSFDRLPDILAEDLQVVFCGINPATSAAVAGHHFVARSNRFWRAIHLAGFTPNLIRPEDDRTILRYRCGLTAAVARPTMSADQVSAQEFAAGAAELERKIARYAPRFIAFLGKAAIVALSGQRDVAWGEQPGRFGDAGIWVLPNPSGRNRAFSLEQLVLSYRELFEAANRA